MKKKLLDFIKACQAQLVELVPNKQAYKKIVSENTVGVAFYRLDMSKASVVEDIIKLSETPEYEAIDVIFKKGSQDVGEDDCYKYKTRDGQYHDKFSSELVFKANIKTDFDSLTF